MAKKVTEKKKAAPKKEAIKLDPTKMYEFTVTKDTTHLKKGVITITGEMCEIFITKGIGSVKS